MNQMYQSMLVGVLRAVAPFLAAKGIDLDNDQLEQAIQGGILALSVIGTIYNKFRVNRKIQKVAATGLP